MVAGDLYSIGRGEEEYFLWNRIEMCDVVLDVVPKITAVAVNIVADALQVKAEHCYGCHFV